MRSVAFDPEGTFVAAVQADGCLLVMDWAANKVVKKHVAPRVGACCGLEAQRCCVCCMEPMQGCGVPVFSMEFVHTVTTTIITYKHN